MEINVLFKFIFQKSILSWKKYGLKTLAIKNTKHLVVSNITCMRQHYTVTDWVQDNLCIVDSRKICCQSPEGQRQQIFSGSNKMHLALEHSWWIFLIPCKFFLSCKKFHLQAKPILLSNDCLNISHQQNLWVKSVIAVKHRTEWFRIFLQWSNISFTRQHLIFLDHSIKT